MQRPTGGVINPGAEAQPRGRTEAVIRCAHAKAVERRWRKRAHMTSVAARHVLRLCIFKSECFASSRLCGGAWWAVVCSVHCQRQAEARLGAKTQSSCAVRRCTRDGICQQRRLRTCLRRSRKRRVGACSASAAISHWCHHPGGLKSLTMCRASCGARNAHHIGGCEHRSEREVARHK